MKWEGGIDGEAGWASPPEECIPALFQTHAPNFRPYPLALPHGPQMGVGALIPSEGWWPEVIPGVSPR